MTNHSNTQAALRDALQACVDAYDANMAATGEMMRAAGVTQITLPESAGQAASKSQAAVEHARAILAAQPTPEPVAQANADRHALTDLRRVMHGWHERAVALGADGVNDVLHAAEVAKKRSELRTVDGFISDWKLPYPAPSPVALQGRDEALQAVRKAAIRAIGAWSGVRGGDIDASACDEANKVEQELWTALEVARAYQSSQQATTAGLEAANGHLTTLLNECAPMLADMRKLVNDLHAHWSPGGMPERGEYPLLDRVDDWLAGRPPEMLSASLPAGGVVEPLSATVERKLRSLMSAVNSYEKATGIGGAYAETVQSACNSLLREVGSSVKFGAGLENPHMAATPQPSEAQPEDAPRFDVTLTEEEAGFLRDTLGTEDDATPIRMLTGHGHSGYGLYLAEAEVQEEGASLLKAMPEPSETQGRTQMTRQQVDDLMTKHFPLDSLIKENVDIFEQAVRDVEAHHGIPASHQDEGGATV
ncbi:MAG: hypothetical protein WAQ08_15985 [Aquabacterium sp.]|uniref:hypothetical protein n=1 Tax=Aquabacterium sp. TaxID=1872578 RepID=UPI003BB07BDF